MNSNHARVCPSPEWAEHMHHDVLPGLCAGLDLGTRMLELGPGPGATTEWLRHRVPDLVAVEVEKGAADALRERFAGTNVHVMHGDASALPFDDDSFDSVGSFTMLHHVPSAALQKGAGRGAAGTAAGRHPDRLGQPPQHPAARVPRRRRLQPAGPALLTRLQTIGFGAMMISVDRGLTFRARKPEPEPGPS